MRSKQYNDKTKKDNAVILELLESRILLNAAGPLSSLYIDNEHTINDSPESSKLFTELDQALIGHNDSAHSDGIFTFFSDPTTWDLTPLLGQEVVASTNELVQFVSDMIENYDEIDALLANKNETGSLTNDTPYISTVLASGASNTLYLNFNPAIVTPRYTDGWLYSYEAKAPGFDLAEHGFGGQENIAIAHIVKFVQEDYAPYNIAVTTEQPTSGQYTTVFVGGDNDWYDANSHVIGIASYDPGNRRESNYGFAFTDELTVYANGSDNVKDFSEYIANLITHESGHTLGANHVNDVSALMNPYLPTKPQTVSFGENYIPNSSQYQDSQTLIGSNIGYKNNTNDDFTNITTIQLNATVDGILERRNDTDRFSFTANNDDEITIVVSTSEYSNLDAYLSLYQKTNMSFITAIDDTNGDIDPTIIFNGIKGAEYVIEVSSYLEDFSGSYQVKLSGNEQNPSANLLFVSNINNEYKLDNLVVNETTTYPVIIENTGDSTLNIYDIYYHGDLEVDLPTNHYYAIAPSTTETIMIDVTASERGESEGYLTFISNNENLISTNLLLSAQVLGSELSVIYNEQYVTDGNIDFNNIAFNKLTTNIITLGNAGDAPLKIGAITTNEIFALDITVEQNNIIDDIILLPNEYLNIELTATADMITTLHDALIITTGSTNISETAITLNGIVNGAVLTMQESDGNNDGIVNFNERQSNQNHVLPIWDMTNNGNVPITVYFTLQNKTNFNLANVSSVTIGAGISYTLKANLFTNIAHQIYDTLTLTSNDIFQTTRSIELNADSYAIAQKGKAYKFKNNDGENITVSINGPGQARIVTGLTEAEGDIKLIDISSSTTSTKLSIKSKTEVAVGDITSNGDLGKLIAPRTTLINDGLSIDGYLKSLKLFNIINNTDIIFNSNKSTSLIFNNISTNGDISATGSINLLKVNNFENGNISANNISKIQILGNLNGNIKTNIGGIDNILIKTGDLSGHVESAGNIKKIVVSKGDLDGTVISHDDINRLHVNKGTISGTINAQHNIDLIKTYNLVESTIDAQINIRKISVKSISIDNTITSGNTLKTSHNIDTIFRSQFNLR